MPQATHQPESPASRNLGLRQTIYIARHRPSRRPAWLWRLACELSAAGHTSAVEVEEPLLDEILQLRQRTEGRSEKVAAAHIRPELWSAWDLFENGGFRRSELEARLLAQQPAAAIDRELNLTDGTTAVYSQVFFDVADRLNANLWVVSTALGPKYHERLAAADTGTMAKAFGYFFGSSGLEAFLHSAVDGEGNLRPILNGPLDNSMDCLEAHFRLAVTAMTCVDDSRRMQELTKIGAFIYESYRAAVLRAQLAAPLISTDVDPSSLTAAGNAEEAATSSAESLKSAEGSPAVEADEAA